MADPAIGALIEDRLYAFEQPEGDIGDTQQKVIVYRVTGTAHDPIITDETGWFYIEKTNFAFLCGDAEYDGAHEVADALVARLYAAVLPVKNTFTGGVFDEVLLVDRYDDDANSSRKAGVFVVYVEFTIQLKFT
jgi:hypothetical protein